MEQTHRIALAEFDEARAVYLEELAELTPERAQKLGEPEPTAERAAELQREAQAVRAAAEHAGGEVVILHHKPFGAVLDESAALISGDFGGRRAATLRNAIVSWRIRGEHGEAVTDEWIRRQEGDLMSWLLIRIEEHWESVRRTAPKAMGTST
ncbi:MAG: hypothetical protein WDA20_13175 [Desulfuromonadales bacterium]